MMHTTKMFKTDSFQCLDVCARPAKKITVRYSISDNGTAFVSFSDDKMVMLHILVDENFKKMAKELLK